jgi:hypothetical protein
MEKYDYLVFCRLFRLRAKKRGHHIFPLEVYNL